MENENVPTAERVSAINRKFYDSVAEVYDRIDSRRKGIKDPVWLRNVLSQLRELASSKEEQIFLDAGSGSGFLSYIAKDYFPTILLLDVSQKMLHRTNLPSAIKLVGDCDNIPLPNESIHVVGAFATLHHLYDPLMFFGEAHRILKPGGILYTDHDIEQRFIAHFQWPLKFYRACFDHGHGYLKACPDLTHEEYKMTEYHGDKGLDGRKLVQELQNLGFEIISEKYHWEGMGPVADLLHAVGITKILAGRGKAPVVRIIAKK